MAQPVSSATVVALRNHVASSASAAKFGYRGSIPPDAESSDVSGS
jgi:hypothetical protein